MRVILASQSPSRKMILEQAGVTPLIRPADVDEEAILAAHQGEAPSDVVRALAEAKAQAIADTVRNARHDADAPDADTPDSDTPDADTARIADKKDEPAIVIGCDSMLYLNGELQGKPHTVATTIERWRAQRGSSAELLTGHCVVTPRGVRSATSRTVVNFGTPSDEDIEAYARSGEPLECAGAFTLEALGGWFVDSIEGDPSGVIGLSLPTLPHSLYELGYSVRQLWD